MNDTKNERDAAVELLACPFCGNAPEYQQGVRVFSNKPPTPTVWCANNECPIRRTPCEVGQWNRRAASVSRREVVEAIRNGKKHVYWGAGDPNCPKDIKAPNGELTELRCKNCDEPKFPICLEERER